MSGDRFHPPVAEYKRESTSQIRSPTVNHTELGIFLESQARHRNFVLAI